MRIGINFGSVSIDKGGIAVEIGVINRNVGGVVMDLVDGVARKMVVITIDVKIDIGGVVILKEGIPIDNNIGSVKGNIGKVTCVV